MAGKLLIKLGMWLNKRFPEKFTAEEVSMQMEGYNRALADLREVSDALLERIVVLEKSDSIRDQSQATLSKKVEVLATENSALKAASALRVRSAIPIPGR